MLDFGYPDFAGGISESEVNADVLASPALSLECVARGLEQSSAEQLELLPAKFRIVQGLLTPEVV